MLTETIIHDCIFKLLRAGDEESLESMCKLLSTIGKDLDSDKAKVIIFIRDFCEYFRQPRMTKILNATLKYTYKNAIKNFDIGDSKLSQFLL